MLNNFIYSVNVILPIFIIVVLGFILGRTGFVTKEFLDCGEKLVFKIALPVMLFCEIAETDVSLGGRWKLIAFCIAAVTASFALTAVCARIFIKNPGRRGSFVQGSCRSNFAVLGIPLAQSMFGAAGACAIAITMPFVIIMFNAYSVIILSVFAPKEEKTSAKEIFKRLGLNIITNPLIIAVVLALPFLIFDISLPVFASRSLGYISGLTTPLALICLGANFRPEHVRSRMGFTIVACALKLVALPALALIAAALCGMRGEYLGTVFILFAAPSAVSSYIMAKNMDNDSDLAAQILLFSTMLCVFTVFAGVFILKSLGLI